MPKIKRTKVRPLGIPPANREPPIFLELRELEGLAPREPTAPLNVNEKCGILYGMCRGWTKGQTAAQYRVHLSTVKKYWNMLYDDPLQVFGLPVIQRVGNGIFQCRLCGETRQRRSQAQRHVLAHFMAHEIAQNIDLTDLPEVL